MGEGDVNRVGSQDWQNRLPRVFWPCLGSGVVWAGGWRRGLMGPGRARIIMLRDGRGWDETAPPPGWEGWDGRDGCVDAEMLVFHGA